GRRLDGAETELLAYFHATLAQRSRDSRHWDEAFALLEPLAQRSPRAELLLATARSARTGPRDHRGSKLERRRAFDTSPLERLSTLTLPPRLRAFALNNHARLLLASNDPAVLDDASLLVTRAQKLAPDPATLACIRKLSSGGLFERDRAPVAPCDLPALP
ncbi:MAG TPA: hypothetical protein VGK73_33045, partial [Polyangiaceae bacterium]